MVIVGDGVDAKYWVSASADTGRASLYLNPNVAAFSSGLGRRLKEQCCQHMSPTSVMPRAYHHIVSLT